MVSRLAMHVLIILIAITALVLGGDYVQGQYYGVAELEKDQSVEFAGIEFKNDGEVPDQCKILHSEVITSEEGRSYLVRWMDCGERDVRTILDLETEIMYLERKGL